MRAWNLIVQDFSLVQNLAMGIRNNLYFNLLSACAKRVHIGDTVVIHNYVGEHRKVIKTVAEKKKVKIDGNLCICLEFEDKAKVSRKVVSGVRKQ